MIKKIIVLAFFGLMAWIAMGVINLRVDRPIPVSEESLRGKAASFAKVAPIIQTNCLPCHSERAQLPWYAQLPPAKQIIQHDIKEGLEEFNFDHELFTEGKKPSTKVLKHIRSEIEEGAMPPLKYLALHWGAFLNAEKKADIYKWIDDEENSGKIFAPIEKPTGLDERKIKLGQTLYHDTRLSGDGTISCATCHDLKKGGGTDQLVTSTGIRGQKGPINAPTVFNARYHVRQFWDGRAADLKEQALGPVTNPLEMGGDWEKILPVLNADSVYQEQFRTIYGRPALKEDVADAIAEFESTLVTTGSRFDQYLKGDQSILTDEEKRGLKLFSEIGCTQCHYGPALGGQTFEKLGVKNDYFKDRGGALTQADLGHFNFTKDEKDKYLFRVPGLRNLEETFPYFHDGSVKTMDEAVEKMAYYQKNRRLKSDETQAIVAYLKSLSGKIES